MSGRLAFLWIALHAALCAGAALLALRLETDTSPRVFLDAADPVHDASARFTETFGEDAFALVTCRGPGDRPFRRRVDSLAGALRAAKSVRRVESPSSGAPLSRALGLADADGTRLSLAVQLEGPWGPAIAEVRNVVARFPDVAPAVAGQPVLNGALQEASDAVGRRLFPLLALTMTLFLWLACRSVRVTLAVLLTTGEAVLLGMAVLALLDRPVNLVTILLPVLLLTLTVALSVHLVNSFRRHRGHGTRAATRRMRREEWRPCLVTSLTTAAGFGSFAFSRIEPLRALGIAMAVSILLALGVAFTLLPALLTRLRPRPREGLPIGALLVRIVPPLVSRRGPVLAVSALLVGMAAAVVPHIPRETNGLRYLPASHPLRRESERLRAEGVGTAALEYVVRPLPGADMAALGTPLRAAETRLAALGGPVRGVVTPLTLIREGAFRLGLETSTALEDAALAGRLPVGEESMRSFRNLDARAVRVSLRIDPMGVDAYRALLARAEGILADALGAAGATFEAAGDYPILMTVQQELLRTLAESLLVAAATIVAVLALAQRSVGLAFLTLAPAAAPLAFVVLACAVGGVALSIATVMVLAVTLGIVTDDSVHMLHALREGRPLESALRHVGTAVTETSVAIFLGFAALGFAAFLPTRQFGLLTAGAMVAALAADLVLFPVLLSRPAPCLLTPEIQT